MNFKYIYTVKISLQTLNQQNLSLPEISGIRHLGLELKTISAEKIFFELISSLGNFVNKNVGNRKTKPTFVISVLKIVSLNSNFLCAKKNIQGKKLVRGSSVAFRL